MHCLLVPLLEQVDLAAHQVRIFEIWVLIDALCGRQDALVVLANFPLNDGLQEQAELLAPILRRRLGRLEVHSHLQQLVRRVRVMVAGLLVVVVGGRWPRLALLLAASALVDRHDVVKLTQTLIIAALVSQSHSLDDLQLDLLLEDFLFHLPHLWNYELAVHVLVDVLFHLAPEDDVLLDDLI